MFLSCRAKVWNFEEKVRIHVSHLFQIIKDNVHSEWRTFHHQRKMEVVSACAEKGGFKWFCRTFGCVERDELSRGKAGQAKKASNAGLHFLFNASVTSSKTSCDLIHSRRFIHANTLQRDVSDICRQQTRNTHLT